MQTSVNLHLKRSVRDIAIIATEVIDDAQRMNYLPNITEHHYIQLENVIYELLGSITKDYKGGSWNYYKLSNMAPKAEKTFNLSFEHEFEHTVSANTVGIIACAMAYSHLSFFDKGESFAKAHQLLSDYIFQHPDAGIIRSALY